MPVMPPARPAPNGLTGLPPGPWILSRFTTLAWNSWMASGPTQLDETLRAESVLAQYKEGKQNVFWS